MSMRNQSPRLQLWLVCLLAVALACGGGGEASGPRAIAQLNILLPADSMHIGEVLQAKLSAKDGSGAAVTAEVWDAVWASSTPSVASVTQRGIVRAVGVGQTTVSATIGGRSSEFVMRVVAIPVALVSLSPLSIVLAPGATRQLVAVPLDATGRELQGRSIAWLSSDTSVVLVSPQGVLTAVSPGLTSVHAISEGSYASADVRVSGPPGPVAKVTLIPAAVGIKIGEGVQLATILEDAIGNVATDRAVAWTSSAPSVATVSASGRVRGVGRGSAVIEAVSEQIRGRATITVLDPNDAITVSFASPDSNDVVSDTLSIYATGSGRNPIVRAYAIVASKETELSELRVGFDGKRQAWVGTLDMRELRYGPYQLIVTVWDNLGNTGIGTVLFKRGARTGAGGTTIPPKIK